jgi:type VI secretion system protein VasD
MTRAACRQLRRGALHALLVLGLISLCGCSLWSSEETPPAPQARSVVIDFSANNDINRDATGRPMPVLINIFELRGPGNFELSDYFDLRDNAQARLGQELLRSDQLMVWPEGREQRRFSVQSATSQLGVIAGYQQLQGRTWRVLIPLPAPAPASDSSKEPHFDVVIRQNGLRVQPILKNPSTTP